MTITPATHAISINPATGEQLSVLPWAGVDDIENALQLAAAGFRDWREANIDYRAEKLRDIGKALRARSEEMAQMITREMGKPINQARAEVVKSASLCDWYAEHGPAMLKAEPTLVENQQAVIEYRPLGTILAIMPWNSLVQLEMEQGIPRNPFINAGALVVCDMLQGRLSAPRQRMLEVVRGLSGVSDISYDTVVARSEFEHSARNAAIAWLMKSFGNFHHDVTTVLQNYFHYCALKMSCVELARTFVFLANQGKAIHIDEPVVTPMQARQINALMATSGMYQNAGEFAWRVGLPAKSGVGGGIVAIVPHEMAIAVWSPELDDAGNSLAGIAVLEQLTKQLGRSVY
ncbi:TPA: glutaminase B [Escherichia coli]